MKPETNELPLDHLTIERLKACKQAQFPLCLDRALINFFKDKEAIVSLANKAGFGAGQASSSQDIWNIYLRFLSSLRKEIDADAVAVIESQSIKEMESMECLQCPLYKMESDRRQKGYSLPLPPLFPDNYFAG